MFSLCLIVANAYDAIFYIDAIALTNTDMQIPDSYGVSVAFGTFIDISISISSLTNMPDGQQMMDGRHMWLLCVSVHSC